MIARIAIATVFLGLPAALQAQEPVTLQEFLARADRASYGNTIARAGAEETDSRRTAALRGILPSLRFEAGYARTTDPIGVFGTTLRQRRIAQENFDPRTLNFPEAVDNYGAGVVVEAPLLNVDAHIGRKVASRGANAARAGADWQRANTKAEVIRAYFGAVLAAEKVGTLQSALTAAQAHVRQAGLMVKAGLVTRSDALLAEVRAGEVQTALLEAEGDTRLAQNGLAMLVAEPDSTYTLPKNLPDAGAIRSLLAFAGGQKTDLESRADVVAARQAADAAALDAARATSLYLPRLNAIGRYDWNSQTKLYGGDHSWTVGLMASWTPFSGASEIADRRGAGAREKAGKTALSAARAQASHELMAARIERDIAERRLDIADRALEQSEEAHRIIARKYAGGLASVIELLDAAAVETSARLAFSNARYLAITAATNLLKGSGNDPVLVANHLSASTGID